MCVVILDNSELIEIFPCDKCPMWMVRIKVYFVSIGYWTVINPEASFVNLKGLTRSEHALELVSLVVGENQVARVINFRFARKPLKELKGIYAELSFANRMLLYERLRGSRPEDENDDRTPVCDMARNHTEICAMGVAIDAILYKLMLLHSLLTRIDNLDGAREAQMDTLSVEEVHAGLLWKDL